MKLTAKAVAVVLLAALLLPSSETGHAADQDVALLLDGVAEIGAPGVPGPLCVYGDEAFPIVVGGSSGETVEPVVAGARFGEGRVVAFGHGGYFGSGTLETVDTGRLMLNAIRWSAGDGHSAPHVGVVGDNGTVAWLVEQGMAAEAIGMDGVTAVDVVLVAPWNHPQSEVDVLLAATRGGRGLVVAATGWGWAQLNPDRDLMREFTGNLLLAPLGIQWAYDWLSRTSADGYATDGPPSPLTHAAWALDAAEEHAAGGRTLTDAEIAQASKTLTRAGHCVPPTDTMLRPRLEALVGAIEDYVVPTPGDPVRLADLYDRLRLTLQVNRLRGLPPEDVPAHPAAAIFPGPVPDDAPRVTRDLAIDARVPGWHSTGLYAPPGEVIEVRVPEAVAGWQPHLRLRIGAHKDTLWGKDAWRRVPEISMVTDLDATVTRVASPYGGLVYLETGSGIGEGDVTVTIGGAVEAPLFIRGRTTLDEWRESVRDHPAPWAEIGSGKMIVTVPSAEVRDLDRPDLVAETWDEIMDLNAELIGRPPERARPERFVVDEQISAGYMHAGYPLMAHLDQQANLVSREHLLGGNWGFFHEVGHNHQSGDWTFAGTTEVTVNLFTLFVWEHLCGVPVAAHERGSDAFLQAQMAKYDFTRPDFEQWKRDPFLALAMYVQLQHAFGWDAYRQVFAEYRDLAAGDRPTSDDEKRDQWLVRMSRTVGRNLGPFFEAWGVPTSAEARASLADLPEWLPDGFPPGQPAAPTATAGPVPTATPDVVSYRVLVPVSLNAHSLKGAP